MYDRIQVKQEPGGIRVALIEQEFAVEDFIWCHRTTRKGVEETVERFYGVPRTGKIEVVKQFEK